MITRTVVEAVNNGQEAMNAVTAMPLHEVFGLSETAFDAAYERIHKFLLRLCQPIRFIEAHSPDTFHMVNGLLGAIVRDPMTKRITEIHLNANAVIMCEQLNVELTEEMVIESLLNPILLESLVPDTQY